MTRDTLQHQEHLCPVPAQEGTSEGGDQSPLLTQPHKRSHGGWTVPRCLLSACGAFFFLLFLINSRRDCEPLKGRHSALFIFAAFFGTKCGAKHR